MEYCSASLPRRLAIEKQLLAEEKFLVAAMKKVQEEQHSLQVERLQIMSMLHELEKKANPEPKPAPGKETSLQPTPKASELTADFDLPSLDDENLINEMDLNLTVPQHSFYETFRDEQEEDDYEIDIGMLMNMKTNKK